MNFLSTAATLAVTVGVILFIILLVVGFIDLMRHMFGDKRNTTPVTEGGLVKYDHLPPMEAAVKAWTTPGNTPRWNRARKDDVRRAMPLLARALDRAVWEHHGNHDGGR